jgi:hypothetical protein
MKITKVTQEDKLHLFLDSRSLARASKNQKIEVVLQYVNDRMFEFVRSPLNDSAEKLQNVSSVRLKMEDEKLIALQVGGNDDFCDEYHVFRYEMDDIRIWANQIYDKEQCSSSEFETVLMIFVYLTLFKGLGKNNSVFVTSNQKILYKREWLSDRLGTNIMTVEESMNFNEWYDLQICPNNRHESRSAP